jgi:D-alanyl-D-alanine carboxypeptidase
MIDLNKDNTIDVTEEIAPSNKQIVTDDREANAKKFLCVMLAIIVAFVGIVCIFVNKRNKTLLAQQKIDEAEKSKTTVAIPQASISTNTENSGSDTSSAETSVEPDTTVVSAGVTAAQSGSLKEPTIITIDEANWFLTLVNSGYRIPDSYEPDLVYVCGSEERLDKKVAEHYEKMYNAALKDGVTLTPCSGYRSYETQERNYNRKVSFFEGQGYSTEDAKVKAATIIMPPGSSEHNLGYAMDIVCVEEWFEDTEEFKWLQKNAADYGFIMRYPKDKQDITNVVYKPWHWRYVGVEAAKEMKTNGQVLEEYMGATQ